MLKGIQLYTAMLMLIQLCTGTGYSQPTVAIADGYAEGTTGGGKGETVTVTDAVTLRSACASTPPKIIIVKGNLGTVGQVTCKSDKTIIGYDTTSGFTGNLTFSGAANFIVQNLNIRNPDGIGTGDGIESSGCSKLFVTKCTFIDCKDGSFDIKNGSDYLTVSWCRFRYPTISGHNLPNLLGHSDNNAAKDRGKLHITMHHNWYDDGCDQRMPRVRFGTVHVYNNLYACPNNTYCIGTGFECRIRVETCVFENVNQPWSDINGMANGGKIGWNDLSLTDAELPTYAPNTWPVFTPSYKFSMDSTAVIKDLLTDPVYGAGNRLAGRRVALLPHAPEIRPVDNQNSGTTHEEAASIFDCSGRRVMDGHVQDQETDRLSSGVFIMKNKNPDRGRTIRRLR